jgi:hypothetical protein
MHLMLDIETLGTKPGCVVLSIGACLFDRIGTAVTFYRPLGMADQLEKGLVIESGTLKWWLSQSENVRKEAFEGSIFSTAYALSEFNVFCMAADTVWGNGATFDQPILHELFNRFDKKWPFNYSKELCFRTLKKAIPPLDKPRNLMEHHALSDAIWQAEYAVYCLQYLHEKGIDL